MIFLKTLSLEENTYFGRYLSPICTFDRCLIRMPKNVYPEVFILSFSRTQRTNHFTSLLTNIIFPPDFPDTFGNLAQFP